MRTLSITLDYLSLDNLLALVAEPSRTPALRILADNRELFEAARGSTHNHQTWDGGYVDHVTDGMNYARHLYALDAALGRPMPFSLSDALLVFYLHDLEKPWRILISSSGEAINRPGLDTKFAFKEFREQKLREYGLQLTPEQLNGLTYVEGEGPDYSSTHRVMNELAAFCHKVDVWSARQGFDYPKAHGDEWTGAGRFRSVLLQPGEDTAPEQVKGTEPQSPSKVEPLWDDEGHPVEALLDKFESSVPLEGAEAMAFLGGVFSNATHNNYSAKQMVHRVGGGFTVTLTKATS